MGEVDEPRAGIRRGTMPTAHNLYYKDLINQEDGTLLDDKAIAKLLVKRDIDTELTCSIYSGACISACVVELAL